MSRDEDMLAEGFHTAECSMSMRMHPISPPAAELDSDWFLCKDCGNYVRGE